MKKNGTADLASAFMICPVCPGKETWINTTPNAAIAFPASKDLFLIIFNPTFTA